MAPKTKKAKVAASSKERNDPKTLVAKRAKADVRPITQLTEARSNKNNKRGGGFLTASKSISKDDDLDKPKEKSEIELENLVFGDNEDLLEETFSKAGHELSSDEEIDERDEFDYDAEDLVGQEGLGEPEDEGSDMFFMDTGPAPLLREEIDQDKEDQSDEDEDEETEAGDENSENEDQESRLTGKKEGPNLPTFSV